MNYYFTICFLYVFSYATANVYFEETFSDGELFGPVVADQFVRLQLVEAF